MTKEIPGETLSKHLKRFIIKDPSREAIVNDLMAQGVSKDEIFRQVSKNLGSPSTHSPGKPIDGMKDS